jgi:hypothetical protein
MTVTARSRMLRLGLPMSHPPASRHLPVAVTGGSLARNLNKTGVDCGPDAPPIGRVISVTP